jgi:hypothetical protein
VRKVSSSAIFGADFESKLLVELKIEEFLQFKFFVQLRVVYPKKSESSAFMQAADAVGTELNVIIAKRRSSCHSGWRIQAADIQIDV